MVSDIRVTKSRDLSKYNLDTKLAHHNQALEITLKSIAGMVPPSVKSEEYTPEFFESKFMIDVHATMCELANHKPLHTST